MNMYAVLAVVTVLATQFTLREQQFTIRCANLYHIPTNAKKLTTTQIKQEVSSNNKQIAKY